MIKLDIGCGKNKVKSQDEYPFLGVDIRPFEGVDLVCDVSKTPWVFDGECPEYGVQIESGWMLEDNSVGEVFSSHFVEHLTGEERVLFFNELHRVLKPAAKALIITPDWSNACAYGDPSHKWPPMSSWYAMYLNEQWRSVNAPHCDYTCDFDWAVGYGWDEWLMTRNDELKGFAMQRYINSARDLHVTLIKRPPAPVPAT